MPCFLNQTTQDSSPSSAVTNPPARRAPPLTKGGRGDFPRNGTRRYTKCHGFRLRQCPLSRDAAASSPNDHMLPSLPTQLACQMRQVPRVAAKAVDNSGEGAGPLFRNETQWSKLKRITLSPACYVHVKCPCPTGTTIASYSKLRNQRNQCSGSAADRLRVPTKQSTSRRADGFRTTCRTSTRRAVLIE
jgi:hypothetical protein